MAKVSINGAELWYEVTGEGQPLLLHHGYTASRVNWQPIADRLKDRYQIILMECRGTGESEHTTDGYNIAQYAKDVVGLLDHLQIETVSYAGHSMGGGIGYQLAVHHADRLNNLILMAPIPAGGTTNLPTDEQIQTRLDARKRGDRAHFLNEMLAMRFRPEVQTNEWFESRVDHLLTVSEGHILGGLKSMHELSLEDDLGTVNIPTLMLAGGVDGLLNANLSDYLKLPNASLHVFSRAGHEVAIHEPKGVAEAIDAFLQNGPVTAATLAERAAS